MTGSEAVKCQDLLDDLSPWLDGRLDDARVAALSAHATSCTTCGAEVREAREADALVRAALPPVEPGPRFLDDLDRRIARADAATPPRRWLSFAAGLLLGAGLALGGPILAQRLGARRQPERALQEFTTSADVLLTNLTLLSGDDPEADLARLRREVETVDLARKVTAAKAAIAIVEAQDPVLARRFALAAGGTERVLARLAPRGEPAERVLFALRDDVERVDLPRVVSGLGRGGLLRPARVDASVVEASLPQDGSSEASYLAGLEHYSRGELRAAHVCWERVLSRDGEDPWTVRAGYWSARASVLEGDIPQAVRALRPVARFSPEAVIEPPLGVALRAELLEGGAFQTRVAMPAPHVFLQPGGLPRDLPADMRDVVFMLGPAVDAPRLTELRSIRIDDREIALTSLESLEPLKVLGPVLARRLHSAGRAEVHHVGGDVILKLRFAPGPQPLPEARRFVRVLGRASGQAVADDKGNVRVEVVEVRGRAVGSEGSR